ncbi:4-(cytidine 5'-diphospho)-2-C-methyl-D-erythritol kinase [Pelobium manganitolerans]|uniref:4-diphosphocytidyl-2-C-methyl-D-erythritol kinase n=1 Tax=Pelobium manganitolerans TaxID=1842495 RepID=A0A419S5R3_9SPHI|nr:4-(cytidine 5'-diphospho)-2-C-methyl-D-erythritol kinase [Pelobium manganitolerans]RKD16184.1 4-(cytidine 5'-diphospho)-2-C-methyl-D-erythritol kinase [Pelobium manganitolerans]
MLIFPSAKINIGLNVVKRRADGYHDLETIFYPIQLCDALELVESSKMKFESSGIPIPGNTDQNLCLKAYQLLRNDFDLPNIHIHLLKKIPVGAGLGGGSADAAFFIKLVNQYFKLNLNVEQMQVYCRKLGADCAFFIENKPVYAFAKGDEFENIEIDLSAYHIALLMPNVHVSTAEAYAGVNPKPSSKSLKELIKLPVSDWQQHIYNDFEPHILKAHPIIAKAKKALYQAGALFSLMSGSGASVYGIFDEKADLSGLENEFLVFNDLHA